MPHKPAWHILDSSFPGSDNGLLLPARTITANGVSLQIQNLDRTDPPGYQTGSVPRSDEFNRNVFSLSPNPCMPAIPVECSITGFEPAICPIYWRLVCRHVLCRFCNIGQYRYYGTCETFDREWRGESRSASFEIFSDDATPSTCTYNDRSRVLGGHAFLQVAALVGNTILSDYVHLRIAGSSPIVDAVCQYLQIQLSEVDPNILYMLQAVFRHESASTQFNPTSQASAVMIFTRAYHNYNPFQRDCIVEFDWPRDPVNFPLASFDFGVGISQFTEVGDQKVTADIAWDWRENVRQAANLFLGKLQSRFEPGISWIDWAMKTWAAYNGSGARAQEYANEVAKTPEAARISAEPVAALPGVTLLPPPPPLAPPGGWLV